MARQPRRLRALVAASAAFALFAAGCGDDSDDSDEPTDDTEVDDEEAAVDPEAFEAMLEEVCATDGDPDPAPEPDVGEVDGGEFADLGTFAQGPPDTLDPAVNTTLNAAQVIQATHDGLTTINYVGDEAEVVPHVAETIESNEDGDVWTFTIRDGLYFSNGEQVLPSSFVCAWERAASPNFPEPVYYAYLFNFIDGGEEKLAGEADTMAGLSADDEAMTLTVELAEPYAAFDAAVNHATFFPVPKGEILALGADQDQWTNMTMVGNGPFMMESERTDQSVVLVPNPYWDGTLYDDALELDEQPHVSRLTFEIGSDIDTAFNSFEAGEVDSGPVPPQRMGAVEGYPHTRDIAQTGTYYFQIGEDSFLAGDENAELRRAVALAIDREEISDVVWEGAQPPATSMVPEGILGYDADICEVCEHDPAGAEEALNNWLDDGNELESLQVTFNEGAGHEDVVSIIIDNLEAVGIPAERNGLPTEDYFPSLAEGGCVDICRVGWFSDWPVYDSFLYDLFHTDSLGGNNYGYSNEEYDELVLQARSTVDDDERFELFHQAEDILLNQDVGTIPIAHYAGQYVYGDHVAEFPYTHEGDVIWERVRLDG
jgi:oligopeptide transport system substrate-binding protein